LLKSQILLTQAPLYHLTFWRYINFVIIIVIALFTPAMLVMY